MQALSYVFSILSVIFYSIVYFPQFRLIYKNKNSDDISILMLIMWSQADALSLLGVLLLKLEINLVIIGWYHLFIGILMIIFTFYYKKERTILYASIILFFVFSNVTLCAIIQSMISEQLLEPGEIIGWITTSLYILGRFPQIYHNFTTKSVEGLSLMMYIYTILGNMFYIFSIITFSIEPEYLRINMPWIILGISTITLDLFVIIQCKYYKRILNNNINYIDF